jgi:periplasmic copper chaperone A
MTPHASRTFPARLVVGLVAALFLTVGAAGPVSAHSYKLGAIEIGHLWAKPSSDQKLLVTGPLLNSGKAPDRLIRVTSGAARAARMTTTGGTAVIDAIELPPGKPVSLAPWREHIVLEGVANAGEVGARIPMTLVFDHAGHIDVEVIVEATPGD